ncbi:hypothetical protein LTR70_010417 [Exophiala xenobiotica]|uniref:Uncharacterized protein n=1 Tax=Lithohypha guttulata TaxID=1690604 RepID=A0ABR0JU16_9EURO|nr:hypothetical protein LTR24_010393 [Lithohypha guttulata]KAK5309289.1 hypothetical protein LTR70_010417 [Exophiala xenobiotica]
MYDVTSDQRRKIANQKNIQELSQAQSRLERHRELLGGIIAILRGGGTGSTEDLVAMVRSGVGLSQIAAHVRNARRATAAVESFFGAIEFVIDGGNELPPLRPLLNASPNWEASLS